MLQILKKHAFAWFNVFWPFDTSNTFDPSRKNNLEILYIGRKAEIFQFLANSHHPI